MLSGSWLETPDGRWKRQERRKHTDLEVAIVVGGVALPETSGGGRVRTREAWIGRGWRDEGEGERGGGERVIQDSAKAMPTRGGMTTGVVAAAGVETRGIMKTGKEYDKIGCAFFFLY